jgi:TonB family protein
MLPDQKDENNEDLYQILGVPPDSSMAEIRGAYRILSSAEADSGNHKERLQQAYEVLSDPKKRAQYDRQQQKFSPSTSSKQTKQSQDFKPAPLASNYLLYAVSLVGVAFAGFWLGYKLFGGSANLSALIPRPSVPSPSTSGKSTTANADLKSQPFKRPAKPYTPPARSSVKETAPTFSEPIEPTISSQPETLAAQKGQEGVLAERPSQDPTKEADASPLVQGVGEQASPKRDAKALSIFSEETIQRLNRTWNPIKGKVGTVPILRVTLNQSGEITNTQVIQQSDDPDANSSAMETIQQSAPFAPLPSGYQAVTLSLTFGQRVQGSVQGNV